MNRAIDSAQIVQAHELYCRLTGQKLRLDYVRERQWYELLHQGFTIEEVRRVIVYLQRVNRGQPIAWVISPLTLAEFAGRIITGA